MTIAEQDEHCLGRLRLIRLPPASISLPSFIGKRSKTVPVELAVGVTDDYGVDLMFDSLDLKVELLDAQIAAPPANVTLCLEGSSSSSSSSPPPSNAVKFTFTPSRGPFHTLKLSLVFSPSSPARPLPKALSFRLSVESSSASSDVKTSSAASTRLRTLIGANQQGTLETWDDRRYVFLSLTSGPVEVKVEGKEAKGASEKVQTALRTLHLPSPTAPSPAISLPSSLPPTPSASSSITVVERPSLNNSTGQRLWDCAIGLSTFFSLFPDSLDASLPLTILSSTLDERTEDSLSPPTKKPRLSPPASSFSSSNSRPRRLKLIELGAGCALASMAAKRLSPSLDVLVTDVEATVTTTLRENLVANGLDGEVDSAVLDWGKLDGEKIEELRRTRDGKQAEAVTLVGTDVLYNPSSHQLLLDTLLSFLRPTSPPSSSDSPASSSSSRSSPPTRALIAYKRRTDGDDGFFPLCEQAGLRVERVWGWGEVGVWCIE
ncbi:hypothetical protein JCM8547_008718 [Rhodosporidiobolus lusitaniae]